MKRQLLLALLGLCTIYQSTAQETNTCQDTIKYTRRNVPHPNFVAFTKPGYTGYGQCFPLQDSAYINYLQFYCYNDGIIQHGTLSIYYADSNHLPQGSPIYTQPVTVPRFPYRWVGVTFWNTLQTVSIPPLLLTRDFVVTIEAANGSPMKLGSSHWTLKQGAGLGLSSILINGQWRQGKKVLIETPHFYDADLIIEPVLTYKLKADFLVAPESCPGNGDTIRFINTSYPLMDPIYSPSYNPILGQVNTYNASEWNYGDGSPIDLSFEGKHFYPVFGEGYYVQLRAQMKGWSKGSTCAAHTTKFIGPKELNGYFNVNVNARTAYFFYNGEPFYTYHWDFGDGTTSDIQNPVHIYKEGGTYDVTLMVKEIGCKDTITDQVQISPVGIGETADTKFRMFPNPSTGIVQLESHLKTFHLILTNTLGTEVFRQTIEHAEGSIDLSSFPKGLYLMSIFDGEYLIDRKKLILE